jgi:hypothetical protein
MTLEVIRSTIYYLSGKVPVLLTAKGSHSPSFRILAMRGEFRDYSAGKSLLSANTLDIRFCLHA